MKVPVVSINNFCLNHAGYFDWLTVGFGLLAEQGKVGFQYRLPLAKSLLRHRQVRWGAKTLARSWVDKVNGSSWCLEGSVDLGGKVISFVFDTTDHGDLWDVEALERCDIYFKCQLPKSFPGDLQLCKGISRPMPPEVGQHAAKVRPAMLGRPLSRALDFSKNVKILRRWEAASQVPRTKRIFAYFGGDHDPEVSKLGGQPYQHPNVKRAHLVRFLRGLNHPLVDSRLIESRDASLIGPPLDEEPFRNAVGAAAFNVNVAGFSRSIPFRFIDSFLAGTTVLTDDLAIRWYEPFDSEREVIEIGPMGYELDGDVNWPSIENQLLSILETPEAEIECNRTEILGRYRRLWAPEALASYVIEQVRQIA